jgi:hypothetical protein
VLFLSRQVTRPGAPGIILFTVENFFDGHLCG